MCREIFLQQRKDKLVAHIPSKIITGGKFPGVKVCFILMMLNAHGTVCSDLTQTRLAVPMLWRCEVGLSKSQQYPGHKVKTTRLKNETFILFGESRRKHRWTTSGKDWLLSFMGVNSSPRWLVCDDEQGDPHLNMQYCKFDFFFNWFNTCLFLKHFMVLHFCFSVLPSDPRNHCGNKFHR